MVERVASSSHRHGAEEQRRRERACRRVQPAALVLAVAWGVASCDAPLGPGVSCELEPARTCPEDQPPPGAPCVDDLSCEYPAANGETWRYMCVEGGWEADIECADDCPAPPLAEGCRLPFEGNLPRASVQIGPPSGGVFRPFETDEMVSLVWGPQGAPMFVFRVMVDVDEAPDCVRVETTLASEGSTSPTYQSNITLHCGESLAVFAIVPFAGIDCEERVFEMDATVTVDGAGTAAARVRFQGGDQCFG